MELESLKKILYVDDEKVNLELFRLNFKKEYQVLTCLSGFEGIEIVKQEDIKVVISDLRMPGINGIEMIEEIKKIDPSIICILLTAFIEPQVMLKAINEEIVFRYITKPWKKEEVKNIIELAFERYYKTQVHP
jgi:response regulator RpfG family c-di-GMP phosphodiesterase